MFSIGGLIADLLQLFLLCLFVRLILDYVRMAKPDWRPSGIILIAADFIYAVTDKPLRLGGISIDLSMLILFIVISRIAPLLRSL